ncbi:hypothetical protein PQQ52_26210 [Paraburkholderia sediminicola]
MNAETRRHENQAGIGKPMAPARYMIACVVISLGAVMMLEETGGRDLA